MPANRLIREQRIAKGGFSIVELVAVVSVLSILAGISIPAFFSFIKSSRIDQTKATLNAVIAECLQLTRTDPDNAETAKVEDYKLSTLDSSGYKIQEGKDKCSDFMVIPKDEAETFLYPMGFMIRNGRVSKVAMPAQDKGSLGSCEAWGTCGVSAEQQAEWDRLAAIETAKKECNDNFYSWLRKPSSGSNSRWDENGKSCSVVTWAFEGNIQADEAGYKAAEKQKYGEICAKKTQDIQNAGEITGEYRITECGERTFFFCSGVDKGTAEAMETCIVKQKADKCSSDRESTRTSGFNGKYGGLEGPAECGKVVWMCNGTLYESEELYVASPCGCRDVTEEQCTVVPSCTTQNVCRTVEVRACRFCQARQQTVCSPTQTCSNQRVCKNVTKKVCGG